jgi:hypothetical protein
LGRIRWWIMRGFWIGKRPIVVRDDRPFFEMK